MKVTLDRDALVKAMTRLARVIERRNTIPIISNIHIEANEDGLALKATDLDLELRDRVRCDVIEPGCLTVPANTLLDIARKLSAGAQVALETDSAEMGDKQLIVRSGRSRFKLNALAATDFPDMDAGEATHTFTLASADFKALIDKTQFAISTEETRYYLNGIYLHHAEEALDGAGSLRAVATDGHRLAQFDTITPDGAPGMPGIIIPRKAVAEIFKLVEDCEIVQVALSSSKIRLTFGGVTLTSKLIDGTFPDYRRVIPNSNDKRLVVDREEFRRAVDRVSAIAGDRGRAIKLTLADNKIICLVTNPDAGSAMEEIEAEYGADKLDIGFNAKYLLDITAHLEGHTALITLADSGSPTLIQDREGAAALYVLMPMRV